MVPIATTTSFVQNGHWSSPDWISSVVLKDFLFIFQKIQNKLWYSSTPVLLHRGDVNCDWQITARCQRVREKSLVIAVLRYIQDKHIYVMAQVAWRTGDIIITDTICPPRSSVYSAGTIEDGIDGTCVLSNQFSMNVHTHIPQSIYQHYAWLSSSSFKMFQ